MEGKYSIIQIQEFQPQTTHINNSNAYRKFSVDFANMFKVFLKSTRNLVFSSVKVMAARYSDKTILEKKEKRVTFRNFDCTIVDMMSI